MRGMRSCASIPTFKTQRRYENKSSERKPKWKAKKANGLISGTPGVVLSLDLPGTNRAQELLQKPVISPIRGRPSAPGDPRGHDERPSLRNFRRRPDRPDKQDQRTEFLFLLRGLPPEVQ